MKNETYPIHQSALFKIHSKKRLGEILGTTVTDLKDLLSKNNYHEFPLQPNPSIDHPKFQRKSRPIQNPNDKLKVLQKRILRLLNRIIVPDYLYSATKGRSYIDNADQHKDNPVVFCVDIKDFYGNTRLKQVRAFFLDILECSSDVAFILSSLVCYKNKDTNLSCLPTGGSASPLLSFWVNKGMFDRLSQYALSNNLTMTVYVDDVTFSGIRISKQMQSKIISIITEQQYIAHKFKYYGARAWKIITGSAVKNGLTKAPHKLKAKMRIAKNEIRRTPHKREHLIATLNGLAGAICQLESISPPHRVSGKL